MVNATKKWILLKLSSMILIPLLLWFITNLVVIYDKDFQEVLIFFSTISSQFLTCILIIVGFFYYTLSISEIFEDYIHNKKLKNMANKLLYFFATIIPLITIVIISNLGV